MKDKCIYCNRSGVLRVEKERAQFPIPRDIYVCDMHWNLLKDPKTAIPLIRGHLSLELRGTDNKDYLEKKVDKFVDFISEWKPKKNLN